jgi:hypothetical protein
MVRCISPRGAAQGTGERRYFNSYRSLFGVGLEIKFKETTVTGTEMKFRDCGDEIYLTISEQAWRQIQV